MEAAGGRAGSRVDGGAPIRRGDLGAACPHARATGRSRRVLPCPREIARRSPPLERASPDRRAGSPLAAVRPARVVGARRRLRLARRRGGRDARAWVRARAALHTRGPRSRPALLRAPRMVREAGAVERTAAAGAYGVHGVTAALSLLRNRAGGAPLPACAPTPWPHREAARDEVGRSPPRRPSA